ncbi:hypothetical protein GCM10023169_15090 [Georgenia halophila]|uniref:Uncharacterized protein n=1 Tax=Georgenia halophila TaxID=620889 RepID=A0ABP8L438_9MICO
MTAYDTSAPNAGGPSTGGESTGNAYTGSPGTAGGRRPDTGATTSGGSVVPTVSAVVVGVLVGLAGTFVHRLSHEALPEGLAGALVLVVLGGVFARAAADRVGVLLYALAALLTALALTYLSPNQDVLVTNDLASRLWLLGLPIAGLIAAATPSVWYSDHPRRPNAAQAGR